MRTIGLIGGMSWESTAEYYRLLNEGVRERRGGHHSARLLLDSVDFGEIVAMQRTGAWDEAAAVLAGCARRLETAGAELLLLCSNLMHKVAPAVEDAVQVPLLHIGDAVGEAACAGGHARVGLLGAGATMREPFYRERLGERFGVDVIVPDESDLGAVDRIVYDELTRGRVEDASREVYRGVIDRLAARGAGAVVLGCTEITLLVGPEDTDLPVLDSTRLHVQAALSASAST